MENSKSTVWYKVTAGFYTEVDSENVGAPHQSTKMDHNGDSSSRTNKVRVGIF